MYTHAYNDIKHLLGGAETQNAANVDRISPLYRGQHLVTFATENVFAGDSVSVQWKDKTRDKVGMAINDTFKFAVKSFACSQNYYDSLPPFFSCLIVVFFLNGNTNIGFYHSIRKQVIGFFILEQIFNLFNLIIHFWAHSSSLSD